MSAPDALVGLNRQLIEVLSLRAPTSQLDGIVTADHEFVQTIVAVPPGDWGLRGLRRLMRFYKFGLSEFDVRLEDEFSDGVSVVTRFHAEATNHGVMGILRPTGKRLVLAGALVSKAEVDAEARPRLSDTWLDMEMLPVLRQMGVARLVDPIKNVMS